MVANLFSFRIDIHGDHIAIGWGQEQPVADEGSVETNLEREFAQLSEHESRLDDLDNLIHLLVQSTAADDRMRERDVLALAREIERQRQRNETRWRSLAMAMRAMQPPLTQPTSFTDPD